MGKVGLYSSDCRDDIIKVYKIMRSRDRVNTQFFFLVGESRTREHWLKVREDKFNRNIRGNFFTQGLVRVQNELPEEVIEAGKITIFKRHLTGTWIAKLLNDME